jgi:L-threonylcarbamoyladenylate synthase
MLDGHNPEHVQQAAQALARGELLGLPTETVYGLAADADNAQAVAKIFSTKGRPSDHPLIVHVAEAADASHFASDIPAFAAKLMAAFWPGPLTLILPRREGVAAAAAGGHATVGVRCPAHPVAHAVLRECQRLGVHGLAAPSANRFGRVSPTTAQHVASEFADLLVLDGGACAVGIESTIVDCTRGEPVILRPGMISREQIQRVCELRDATQLQQAAPKASGTLEAHYAPRAKVRMMDAKSIQAALDILGTPQPGEKFPALGVYSRSILALPNPSIVWRAMPQEAALAAAELFARLREFDDEQVQLLWVEPPPDEPGWEGVTDRLRRAAASA